MKSMKYYQVMVAFILTAIISFLSLDSPVYCNEVSNQPGLIPQEDIRMLASIDPDSYDNENIKSDKMLQFTAGGHVLGFQKGVVYIAAADHLLRINFKNSNLVSPLEEAASSGSFRDNNPARSFKKVTYPDLWEGIDLVFEKSANGVVKSSYYVEKETNPSQIENIRLCYNVPVTMDDSGSLLLNFETGRLRESPPVAWQDIKNDRMPVDVSFQIIGEREVGFKIGAYDISYPLVIDPVLSWNTFMGGPGQGGITGQDHPHGIAVDSSGNVYIAGNSNDTWGSPVDPFAGDAGSWNVFAAKLDSSGVLEWNTFMGGPGESYSDYTEGFAIAVDGAGNVFVTGYSYETWGSPVNPHSGGMDAFVVKLDTNGTRLWNTFMGSTFDPPYGIATDISGNVYVGGYSDTTWGSPVNPHSGGGSDAFVFKLDSSGGLQWNTFMGGTGNDSTRNLTVDGPGNVYITGYSYAAGWGSPVNAHTGESWDAFAAKLDNNGARLWNTFMGSADWDEGCDIEVDGSGNVYVQGVSDATWGSPVNPFEGTNDAFVVKLDSSGVSQWNTFMGSADADRAYGVDVDSSGNVYTAGYSISNWGSPDNAHTGNGSWDAFAAKLDTNGAIQWNTFMGSTFFEEVYGLDVDETGNIHIAGRGGGTWGSPVKDYTEGSEVFAVKFIPESGIEIPISTVTNNNYQSGANMFGNASLASNGTNYLAVWLDNRTSSDPTIGNLEVRAARIGADGTVLDPDGIQVQGSSVHFDLPCVGSNGTDYLVTYVTNDGEIYAKRISGSDGSIIGSEIQLRTSGLSGARPYPIVWTGSVYLILWADYRPDPPNDISYVVNIYGSRVTSDGEILDPVNGEYIAGDSTEMDIGLALASDGNDNVLLTWEKHRCATPCGATYPLQDTIDSDIYALRLTASDTGSIAPVGTEFAIVDSTDYDLRYPSIAWDGTNYMAVWSYLNGVDWDVHSARIQSDGTILDTGGFIVNNEASHQFLPDIVWNGSYYFIVWADYRNSVETAYDIYGARVLPNATVVDTNGLIVNNEINHQWYPSVAWNGENNLVAWKDFRTGLVYDIYGVLFDAFADITYNLYVEPLGSGSITINPTGGTYDEGTRVTIEAIPDGDCVFIDWGGDLSGTTEIVTITMDSNKSITANFNCPPDEPTPSDPEDEDIYPSGVTTTIITMSAFIDPDDDTLASSRWMTRSADSVYGRSDYDPSFNNAIESGVTHTLSGVTDGMKYTWKVAYEDSGSGVTDIYSAEYSFKVGDSITEPMQPMSAGTEIADFCMMSFPYWCDNPRGTNVFGVSYDKRYYRIGRYDAMRGGYIELSDPACEINPGEAYWVLAREGLKINVSGIPVNTLLDIEVKLHYNPISFNGWNQIGCPNYANYDWGDVEVVVYDESGNEAPGTPIAISDLSDPNIYIETTLWGWVNGSYDSTIDYLEVYEGYWVRAKMENVYLRFRDDVQQQVSASLGRSDTMFAELMGGGKKLINEWALTPEEAIAESNDSPPMPMGGLDEKGSMTGCFIETVAY